jgi:hypothetical protein
MDKVTFSILFELLFQRAALALPPLVDLAVHLQEEITYVAKVSVAPSTLAGKGDDASPRRCTSSMNALKCTRRFLGTGAPS